MSDNPVYLSKCLRDKRAHPLDVAKGLDMSADGVFTKDGLDKLIAHFTRFRVYPDMHPSWYQGEIPKNIQIAIWDGMLTLYIPLDWAPCSPMMDAKYIYDVPRNQAHMFADGSILDTHVAARIHRSFVDASCIFALMEKDIVPYFGKDFLAIRSHTKSSLIFARGSFDIPNVPSLLLDQRVNLDSMANQVKIKYR